MGGKPRTATIGKPTRDPFELTLALPKGRLAKEVAALFSEAGYNLDAVERKGRRLWADCGSIRVLVLRGADIATYVSSGIADVGVVGSDILRETEPDLYEPLDLKLGCCRLAVAEVVNSPIRLADHGHLRIASKYPNLARAHYGQLGLPIEVVKLGGAVELAPLLGLADQIVDLVETGETLRQNGLHEVEIILDVSARLVVNRASFRLRHHYIGELIDKLSAALFRRAGFSTSQSHDALKRGVQ